MEQQPLVSIIVNCYNSAKFLRPTIDSILAQTYHNYEVIFWDNQSTDDTASIIKSYDDNRFHYYYAHQHVTLGEARNCAIKKAAGEYLSFLDSDDIWLPEFLLRGVECLKNNSYKFYYSNYLNWIEGKSEVVNNKETESGVRTFGDMLKSYHVGMSAAIIDIRMSRTSDITFNNKYQLIEDYDFFLKLLRQGNAYYDAMPLMKYRMHEASLTNSSKKNWAVEFEMLYNDLTTTVLDVVEQKEYASQLRWLRVRSVNARAEELIRDGKRMSLLSLILKNCYLDLRLLFPLAYLVMSQKCYYKLKSKLLKTSYRVA